MQQRDVEIVNKLGLHARPSAKLTQLASSFKSNVFMARGNKKINAKSIMGVLSLGVKQGEKIYIFANGDDEEEAVLALEKLVDTAF